MKSDEMNEDRTQYLHPLENSSQEKVHRFFCRHCGASTLYTDWDYNTALIDIKAPKCCCGHILFHRTEYKDKDWVDKNLRQK